MNNPGPGMMPFSQQQYTPQQNPFGQAMGRGMQQPQFGMQQPRFGMQQPSFGGGFGMQQPSFGGFGGGVGGGFGMQPPQFGGGFGMQQPSFGGFGGFGMQQPGFGGGFGMQQPGFGMGMGGFPSQRFPGLQVSGPSPFQFGGGFGMQQPRFGMQQPGMGMGGQFGNMGNPMMGNPIRPDISLPTGFRGGQMGGPMGNPGFNADNMSMMRRQQDMLRQMQNRGGFQTQGPESFDRRPSKVEQHIARLPPIDLSKVQARLQQIDARPPIARLQQQQQGDRSMPRAITGREQLMRRRSPVYQGPAPLVTLQNAPRKPYEQ